MEGKTALTIEQLPVSRSHATIHRFRATNPSRKIENTSSALSQSCVVTQCTNFVNERELSAKRKPHHLLSLTEFQSRQRGDRVHQLLLLGSVTLKAIEYSAIE